jgi:hypothetical protein
MKAQHWSTRSMASSTRSGGTSIAHVRPGKISPVLPVMRQVLLIGEERFGVLLEMLFTLPNINSPKLGVVKYVVPK